MRGKLIDLSYDIYGHQQITLQLNGDFLDQFERLRGCELDVEITKHREKRTLNENSYFHVLLNKIAEEQSKQGFGESVEEVKRRLVTEYGTVARDDNGCAVAFQIPSTEDPYKIYPYVSCFDHTEHDGKLYNCYLVYKKTSAMNTQEMCRLIDGTIQEAKELGIETETPAELARLKALWLGRNR